MVSHVGSAVGSAETPDVKATAVSPPASPSWVKLAGAGGAAALFEQPRFEFSCSACGYGVVAHMAPESCPMCRGSVWEHVPRAQRVSERLR